MAAQPDLFATRPAAPEGFQYRPDLLGPAEEAALARRFEALPFQPFDFHGHLANRHVVWFGWRYDYGSRAIGPVEPIPDFLIELRAAAAAFGALPAEALEQVLINRYAAGAGIGWHRDKAQFGQVVAVSLLAPCILRFRQKAGESWKRFSLTAEPRSVYLLSGDSRWAWEHSIPPVDALRYSVTFRTLAPIGR